MLPMLTTRRKRHAVPMKPIMMLKCNRFGKAMASVAKLMDDAFSQRNSPPTFLAISLRRNISLSTIAPSVIFMSNKARIVWPDNIAGSVTADTPSMGVSSSLTAASAALVEIDADISSADRYCRRR